MKADMIMQACISLTQPEFESMLPLGEFECQVTNRSHASLAKSCRL